MTGDNNDDGDDESAVLATSAEQRQQIMEDKFKELLAPRGLTMNSISNDAATELAEFLIISGTETVSTQWFCWAVDMKTWTHIQLQVVREDLAQGFPWMHHEPQRQPQSAQDVSTWFNIRKDAFRQKNDLPALRKRELGMPLMQQELRMRREIDGVTSIDLRQEIWDDVFPGGDCSRGQPFELAVPSAAKCLSHLLADPSELKKFLPAAVAVVKVTRLNTRGHFVDTIIISYAPSVADNRMNRMSMALAYNIALDWAKKIVISGTSMPLSRAFEDFDIQPEDENKESPRVVGMATRPVFTPEQLALCAEELALMPWISDFHHACYLVGRWLEKEMDRTSAEDRCKLLREWCRLKHGSIGHCNITKLTQDELRKACWLAWKDKVTEWMRSRDVLSWSWNEEVHWSTQVMGPDA